ncbi:MAG: serine--tRNA ligase, partial [Candidatus Aenigmarchaeota archaeon CG_4_10_14_3_um_filter_37_21]
MLDIKLIREDSKTVRENLEKRQNPELIKRLDYVIKFDKAWRDVFQELNSSRKRKNEINLEIAKMKKEGQD